MSTENPSGPLPSSNWMALQKKLKPKRSTPDSAYARKKRKIQHEASSSDIPSQPIASTSFPRGPQQYEPQTSVPALPAQPLKNGDSLSSLRAMVAGEVEYNAAQKLPGKYLALDCEMVGVGLEGIESSLARISLVNYHGAVQMDEFVRQRERVVDYRTEYSGIRPSDMETAKPFIEVQKQVADLLKDRILVGHAVHNDLKALLLSHPRPLIRDTQQLAGRHKVTKTRRPALRHLVQQELGIAIQGGEHSSVIDARATMAVYRLHRKTWEASMPSASHTHISISTAKRKLTEIEADAAGSDEEVGETIDDAPTSSPSKIKKKHQGQKKRQVFPGGGRKGVSSGLSTVVTRKETKTKTKWWAEL